MGKAFKAAIKAKVKEETHTDMCHILGVGSSPRNCQEKMLER